MLHSIKKKESVTDHISETNQNNNEQKSSDTKKIHTIWLHSYDVYEAKPVYKDEI